MGKRWLWRLPEGGEAHKQRTSAAMIQLYGLDPLVADVLAARGISPEQAEDYLKPTLRALMPDPSTLTDMDKAAERIADAIERREQVAIFGDYDVDGACSAALLTGYLRRFGLQPIVQIPDRITDGYGPNPQLMEQLIDDGATLIITVDCGISSFEALAHAKNLSADVVVLDHHQVGAELPEAVALVNPNRHDDLSGVGHLCAAGVVFLTLVALNRLLRARGVWSAAIPEPDLRNDLDIVALATVADVVPLHGLNRAFVHHGLKIMSARQRVGLSALMDVAALKGPPTPYSLGFALGPRINAGGRIGDAALGARLLLENDDSKAKAIAQSLDHLNRERQFIEQQAVEEAYALAERQAEAGRTVLLLGSEGWHPGVVGLIASRLKSRFERPSIAISWREDGTGTGSARSVTGVDLGASVRAALKQGLLIKGGGHAMAAGLTLQHSQQEALQDFLEQKLGSQVEQHLAVPELVVDASLTPRAVQLALAEALQQAGPFGSGNPEPVFMMRNLTLNRLDSVGRDHYRLSLSAPDGARLEAMAFRVAETALGEGLRNHLGKTLHIAGTLALDHYGGNAKAKFHLIDAATG